MENVITCSPKKIVGDTRNNWVTMIFVTQNGYNCFKKLIYIGTCKKGFWELERF